MAPVVETGKGLFGLPWKYHTEGETIDLDTAPHTQSQRVASKAVEAHTLAKIAQLIVESPNNAKYPYMMMAAELIFTKTIE